MLSISNNFLFIHVPKTGGNSIQNILCNYSDDRIVTLGKHQDGVERFEVRNTRYNTIKHSSLEHYKQQLEYQLYKKLFKFSTIRNPWDMCISFYFSPHRGKIVYNKNGFKDFILTIPSIRTYVTTESIFDKVKRKLNIRTNKKPIGADLDFLIRFEHLNDDFKKVCAMIDIPFEELPHRNKSQRGEYTHYYDQELIEIVRNSFSEEIEYGNYVFGE